MHATLRKAKQTLKYAVIVEDASEAQCNYIEAENRIFRIASELI